MRANVDIYTQIQKYERVFGSTRQRSMDSKDYQDHGSLRITQNQWILKSQPSPRTNFSGDSLHRRFVLRAVALKFFDKTNFARMEVTVDLDFAKLSCAEIHAKQIQSALSSGENARTHQQMKDGGSGVCSTMQVRLMSLPLLMQSSELPLIFAFETAHEDRTKLKWFLAGGERPRPRPRPRVGSSSKARTKKYDSNFV